MRLGERIRRERLDRGLRQAAAGELLGVDQSTVSNWERGRRDHPITHKHWERIAEFLHVDVPTVAHWAFEDDEIDLTPRSHRDELDELKSRIEMLERRVSLLCERLFHDEEPPPPPDPPSPRGR